MPPVSTFRRALPSGVYAMDTLPQRMPAFRKSEHRLSHTTAADGHISRQVHVLTVNKALAQRNSRQNPGRSFSLGWHYWFALSLRGVETFAKSGRFSCPEIRY